MYTNKWELLSRENRSKQSQGTWHILTHLGVCKKERVVHQALKQVFLSHMPECAGMLSVYWLSDVIAIAAVMLARIRGSLGLWSSCGGPPDLKACIQTLVLARRNGPPGFLGSHGVSIFHWSRGGGMGDDDGGGSGMQTYPWDQEGCHGHGDKGSCMMTSCFPHPGHSRCLFRQHFLWLRCLATSYSASTRKCRKYENQGVMWENSIG